MEKGVDGMGKGGGEGRRLSVHMYGCRGCDMNGVKV